MHPTPRATRTGAQFTEAPSLPPGQGSAQFTGTATFLIRFPGFTILTDPHLLHPGHPGPLGYGLPSTRLTDPALEIHELPLLDLVLLSHLHEDHFDRVAEREVHHDLPIVTTCQA